MAHGLNSVIKRTVGGVQQCKLEGGKSSSSSSSSSTGVGSRRIFSPQFKLQVLDSYRNDADCKGNQRATARKYGIHRRQIQKWLQVENTLRNGVNGKNNQQSQSSSSLSSIQSSVKNEMSLNNVQHRQRDDESSSSRNVQRSANLAGEARVSVNVEPPSAWGTQNNTNTTGAPFGGTSSSSSSSASAIPMDLSIKKEPIFSSPQISPIPLRIYRPLALPSPSLPTVHQNDDDVWDLSVRSSKRKAQNHDGLEDAGTPKTIKLFKPYLDDLEEENEPNMMMTPIIHHQITTIHHHSTSAVSPPSYNTMNYAPLTPPEAYYVNNNNNNNNVCCDLMKPSSTEFSPAFHPTFHELQPKSSFYPAYHHPYYPAEYHHHSYEEQIISSCSDPLKHHHHRQSYNFDFKLSSIDCCYQENLCKGNPRAVIARYHIHRGEEVNWTSQELLRSSSSRDSLRESHIVR